MSYRCIMIICAVSLCAPIVNANNRQKLPNTPEILKGVAKGFCGGLVHHVGFMALSECWSNAYNRLKTTDQHDTPTASDSNTKTTCAAACGAGAITTRIIDTLLYPSSRSSEQQSAYIASRLGVSLFLALSIHPNKTHEQQQRAAFSEIGAAASTAAFGGNKIVELDGNKLYITGIDCSHWLNSNT